MHQLNFLESILFFTVLFWIAGLLVSLIPQTQRAYWNWTTRNVRNFFQNYWRYILVFILGYYLAVEEFWRLTIQW